MTTLKDLKARFLKDPEVRKEYDALEEEFALIAVELHRSFDDHTAEQIAARASAHRLHALVAQAEYTTGLRLRGNLQRHVAIERGDIDAAAEHRGTEADGHFT